MTTPKLKIDTNCNPTKKGIKVQFILSEGTSEEEKTNMGQKLQTRLNKGLLKYGLTVNIDNDVPYNNVIGFLIYLQDITVLIKKALKNQDINEPQNTNNTFRKF